jgi:hypothetical protein
VDDEFINTKLSPSHQPLQQAPQLQSSNGATVGDQALFAALILLTCR